MKRQRVLYLALPIVLIGAVVLFKDSLTALISSLWPCMFYRVLGVYCPSCGMSRSVLRLLEGDIVTSLRFNVCPLLLLLFGVIGYAEWGTAVFGKHRRLLPRSPWFWVAFGVIMAIYFVARNLIDWMPT